MLTQSTTWRLLMRLFAIVFAFAVATAAAAAAKPVPPVRLTAAQADSVRAVYAKDRSDTEQNLREGATSYLAAIARTDFGEKAALVLGRAPDCDLRVDDPELAVHHLRATVVGDSFAVEAVDDTAHFSMRGETLRAAHLAPGFVRV